MLFKDVEDKGSIVARSVSRGGDAHLTGSVGCMSSSQVFAKLPSADNALLLVLHSVGRQLFAADWLDCEHPSAETGQRGLQHFAIGTSCSSPHCRTTATRPSEGPHELGASCTQESLANGAAAALTCQRCLAASSPTLLLMSPRS